MTTFTPHVSRLTFMIRKPDAHLILLLGLSAFAWLPLLTPGYSLRAHDAPHALFFLQALDEAIRDGAWWPAWGPHFAFGYGYPLWIFYAPLAYYVGEAFHLLGFSLTTSMKLVNLSATLGASLSMYVWARRHFDKNAAVFAALVYTYAPYHLLDLYVRSAVSEYFTFVWFPLVLWRWELLLSEPARRNVILAAMATAALILTHHGAAFIFALLLAAYLLMLWLRQLFTSAPVDPVMRPAVHPFIHLLVYPLSASVMTLGLSAIFWLPMLLEQKYIVVEQWTSVAYNYQKHFVFLNQLFSPFWGYEYSGEALKDGMAFQLGLLPLLMLSVLLYRGWAHWRLRTQTLFFLVSTFVIVWLMMPASAAFWNAVPIAALVQFPWRLLALSTITLAWLAAAALDALSAEAQESLDAPTTMLMLATVMFSFTYTLPQYTERSTVAESARASVDFELISYKDRTGYMTWASVQPQTSPLVPEYQSGQPLTRAIALAEGAQIESLHQGGASQRVRVRSANGTPVQFRIYYFPGWTARVDGRPAPIWPSTAQALITLDVPAGEHVVDLWLADTWVRLLAKAISLLTLWVMLGWIAWRRFR